MSLTPLTHDRWPERVSATRSKLAEGCASWDQSLCGSSRTADHVPKPMVGDGYDTLWWCNIAIENGPFIVDLPIEDGDFP